MNRLALLVCIAMVFVLLVVVATSALDGPASSSSKSDEEARLCQAIIGRCLANDANAGFALIAARTILSKSALDGHKAQLAPKLKDAGKTLGQTSRSELARDERVGDYARRLTYVTMYEKMAVRWTFEFYRATPDRAWVITGVSWDPGVAPLYVGVPSHK